MASAKVSKSNTTTAKKATGSRNTKAQTKTTQKKAAQTNAAIAKASGTSRTQKNIKETQKKTDRNRTAARNIRNASYEEPIKAKGHLSMAAAIIIGLLIALFLELSNFDVFGTFGGWIKYGQFGLFGVMAYIFPVMVLLYFVISTFEEKRFRLIFTGTALFLLLCTFSHLVSGISLNNHNILSYFTSCAESLSGGGIIGGTIALGLYLMLSETGAMIITVLLMLICLFFLFEEPIRKVFAFIFYRDAEEEDEDELYDEAFERRYDRRYYKEDRDNSGRDKLVSGKNPSSTSERQTRRRNRRKVYDEPVYVTEDEDGTVIRIVRSYRKHGRVHNTQLTRTTKRSQPLRSNPAQVTRTGIKVKGISRELDMIPHNANGDEIHEITKRTGRTQNTKKRTNGRDLFADTKIEAGEQLSWNVEGQVSPGSQELLPYMQDRSEAAVTRVKEAAVNRRAKEARPVKVRQGDDLQSVQEDTQNGKEQRIRRAASTGHASEAAPEQAGRSVSGGSISAAGSPNRAGKETTRTSRTPTQAVRPVDLEYREAQEGDVPYYAPPMELLARVKGRSSSSEAELEKIARNLEIILEQFGVNVTVTDIQAGPSVTRFELQPELGTRVNKITSLADDLKLNLGVTEIRIEAPIPGRQAVGIEIPNKNRQTVYMRELLEEPSLINHSSRIAFAAGKDISGNVVVADIAKMPHLLVAGTTGSGKSVFLNTILMTILYRAKPSEVGLIIIDPKKVEFGVYAGIPHLMKDVVTDPGQAVSTLRWAVNEMTNRYQRMQLSSVRDFKSYNAKVEKGTVNPEEENPRKMNQIVIIIDELADLMMVAKKEAEALICRLAQLARAAGIHLIIATQRPSVDVVTGLIKANVPARVALLVSSQVDSRTIIDMQGAEKLLGNGDMLFYPTGYVKPVRVQGAYVSDDEIQQTVDFLIQNNKQDYFAAEAKEIEKFMNSQSGDAAGADAQGGDDSSGKYDECFYEAGKLCIEMGKASSSMLQRRFNLGFNRAARIIDQLEEFGAVGPQNGAKPREILMDTMTFEETYQAMMEGG